MKKLWIALAALAIFIPLGVWWFSPEQVLVRRTKHLMEVISMDEGTRGALRQAKVFSMNAMLAPEVELETPAIPDANGTFDKQELESAFSWICQNAISSHMRILDFGDIEITGDRGRVEVMVEGRLELPVYRPVDGEYLIAIDWIKGADGWRFDKVVARNK